jgi:glycosyltransferase involved in cell wall biosynthesis
MIQHLAQSPARPRAGVALCVYNGARYLQEQLDSISVQTELPLRMAVVDDGSSDGSWALVEKWAAAASFEVRLHRNVVNLGVVRNFECAIELLGDDIEIVFLSDQDDVWYPRKLAMFVDLFTADPAMALLHSDADLIDADSQPLGRKLFDTLLVTQAERSNVTAGRAWEVYAKRNLVTGAACAFRRSLLTHALPFSPLWVHDEWLAFIASLSSRVTLLDEPTMAYRLHQANVVGVPIPTFGWRLLTTWHALTRPTAARQKARGERLREISFHAQRLGASPDACACIAAAAAHADFRGALPFNPFRRWPRVVKEWRAGHYHRWSNGDISMLHDLVVTR